MASIKWQNSTDQMGTNLILASASTVLCLMIPFKIAVQQLLYFFLDMIPAGRQALLCFLISVVVFISSHFSASLLGYSSQLWALNYWGPALYFCLLNFILRYYYNGFIYEVSVRAAFLGAAFATGLYLTTYSDGIHIFGLYTMVLSFFHFSEFMAVALTNPKTLNVDSYILNHSAQYGMAAVNMDGQWLSKHEILNDLATVTGTLGGARELTSIRDRPPHKASELDDESELFLRMYGAGAGGGECVAPDLPNIQRMLQMVYDTEDMPNYKEMEDITKRGNQKLVISKAPLQCPLAPEGATKKKCLNPDVQEFVPKNIQNHDVKSPKKNIHDQSLNESIETKENNEFCPVVCKNNEAQDSLVNHIENIEIPKKVESKKLRENVAMSSINTINKHAEALTCKKLLTPDDFCLKPKLETTRTIEDIMAENLENVRIETAEINENDPPNKINQIEEENDPNIEVSQRDVQESIQKVNNWLEPKTEPKINLKPAEPPKPITPNQPYLGPITYKRKQTFSPASQTTLTTTPTTLTTPESSSKSVASTSPLPFKTQHYKPSAYADELLKKFEKNAAKKVAPSEDMWTKVERELKAKDEVVKKSLEEGNSPEIKPKSRGRRRWIEI